MTRNAELAAIHVAKKELNLDDDLYRKIMHNLTGKSSAKELDYTERRQLLDYFRTKGFKSKKNVNKKHTYVKGQTPQQRYIMALWSDLKKLGALNDPKANVMTWLKKMKITDADHLNWMDTQECSKSIEALKSFKYRVEAKKDDLEV